MHTGSCLCGKITFEILQEIKEIIFCHCPMCRKAQGTAFSANTPIEKDKFKLISGKEYLHNYLSSPDKFRCFCKNCGSPIYSYFISKLNILRLRIGCLDTVPEGKPSKHICADKKATWYEINDNLPQFNA